MRKHTWLTTDDIDDQFINLSETHPPAPWHPIGRLLSRFINTFGDPDNQPALREYAIALLRANGAHEGGPTHAQ